MVFGCRSFHKVEPIPARLFLVLDGEDLDDLTILDVMIEGDHLAVDFGTRGPMADFTVDSIGEVNGRRLFGELDDIALGGKGKDVVFEEFYLETLSKLLVITTDIFLPFFELVDPGQFTWRGRASYFASRENIAPDGAGFLGVEPVGSDTVLGLVVHLLSADLDLEDTAVRTKDSGMERLVAIGLGE